VTQSILDFGQTRILLRDSDTERRRVLSTLLRAEGATVDEADASATAIACLEQEMVSLVLVVASSSDTDGFSLCATISDREGWDTPPVLILLHREDAHVCDVAQHTGAADLIMLPCTGAWILSRVRHLVLAKDLRQVRRAEIARSHAERLAGIGSWGLPASTGPAKLAGYRPAIHQMFRQISCRAIPVNTRNGLGPP
jgi:PleD family two-component response regulator